MDLATARTLFTVRYGASITPEEWATAFHDSSPTASMIKTLCEAKQFTWVDRSQWYRKLAPEGMYVREEDFTLHPLEER